MSFYILSIYILLITKIETKVFLLVFIEKSKNATHFEALLISANFDVKIHFRKSPLSNFNNYRANIKGLSDKSIKDF
jgi:hypothetical protein